MHPVETMAVVGFLFSEDLGCGPAADGGGRLGQTIVSPFSGPVDVPKDLSSMPS